MSLLTKPVKDIEWEDLEEFFCIPQHEGIYLEFKSDHIDNLKLAQSIAAFANSHGGWLFLGINEHQETKRNTGCAKSPKEWDGIDFKVDFESWINSIVSSNIYPYILVEAKPVKIPSRPESMIGIVRIHESESTPHFTQNKGDKKGSDLYIRRLDSKDPNIADREMIELLFNKRSVVEKAKLFFVNRAIDRAIKFGIEETKPSKNGDKLSDHLFKDPRPRMFINCIPKFPIYPLFQYETMESDVDQIMFNLRNSSYYGHSHVRILPDHLKYRQVDSMIGSLKDHYNCTIEITRYGQVCIGLNPDYSQDLEHPYPIIVFAYMASAIVTCLLIVRLMLKFPLNYEVVIKLQDFSQSPIAVLKQPSFASIEVTESTIEIVEDVNPFLGNDHIIAVIKNISSKIAWALNINKYRNQCKDILLEFAEHAFPIITESSNET